MFTLDGKPVINFSSSWHLYAFSDFLDSPKSLDYETDDQNYTLSHTLDRNATFDKTTII